MDKITVGIVGYGNIGRGVEEAVRQAEDMDLGGIFTRRDPKTLKVNMDTPVFHVDDAKSMRDKIDVMILCGGSATDLQNQGPEFAAMFNTVDSFDNHSMIPQYLEKMNKAATQTTAIISTGWDPGLFSMMRLLTSALLPKGRDYTFWGRGVSQGHSDAVRRIPGVSLAVQYTIPIDEAVDQVKQGSNPDLTAAQRHLRECFVVADESADLNEIKNSIVTMPAYFADYETKVHFITEEEFHRDHSEMPHGGLVLRTGETGGYNQIMEFSLKLSSNPMFTGSVMTAFARAALRLSREGVFGGKTPFDIPLSLLLPEDRNDIISRLL